MLTASLSYDQQFAKDVVSGLTATPKRLFSKYFYNDQGDRLFQKIMQLPEYYLTRSEYEIFSQQKEAILSAIAPEGKFQLIEFGAGDGLKTKVLLEYLLDQHIDFEYIPIDISETVLVSLKAELSQKFPSLDVRPIAKSYFEALSELSSSCHKVVLFLGSNIGNFNEPQAMNFLAQVNDKLQQGDHFFIGIDLKKEPTIILNAYNDSQRVTRAFNLNLLSRINDEFDANFDLSSFEHFPTYDPLSGECKSYLISLKEQYVELGKLDQCIHFTYSEPIFMEISKKYNVHEVERLAIKSGFSIVNHFFDCKKYFLNTLWTK